MKPSERIKEIYEEKRVTHENPCWRGVSSIIQYLDEQAEYSQDAGKAPEGKNDIFENTNFAKNWWQFIECCDYEWMYAELKQLFDNRRTLEEVLAVIDEVWTRTFKTESLECYSDKIIEAIEKLYS